MWYKAVLRADECANAENAETFELEDDRHSERIDHHGGGIFIGENTNIQDGCIVTARENHCKIGNGVTVGHLAQIHSATVEDFCLIGMGSIIQPGAVIETESFVAAGAVIGPGQRVKSGELWVGNPGRKLRDLTPQQREKLHYQSSEYVGVAHTQKQVMNLGGNLSGEFLLAAETESGVNEGAGKDLEHEEQPAKAEGGSR